MESTVQRKSKHTIEDYVQSLNNGEEKGFNFFFREYYAGLTYYSFSLTKNKPVAEEIAGEALLKLWERHSNFNNKASIKSFLFTTVHNTSLNWIRQQKRNNLRIKEVAYLSETNDVDKFQSLVEAETYREIFIAINQLPPQCRKIFQMLFLEGKNYHQIAEELNLSVNTIHSQRARGLTLIRRKVAFIFAFVTLFM